MQTLPRTSVALGKSDCVLKGLRVALPKWQDSQKYGLLPFTLAPMTMPLIKVLTRLGLTWPIRACHAASEAVFLEERLCIWNLSATECQIDNIRYLCVCLWQSGENLIF